MVSPKYIPLCWFAAVATSVTYLVLRTLNADLNSVMGVLNVSEPFVISVLVYEFYTALAVLTLSYFLRREGANLSDLGFRTPLTSRAVLYGVGGGIASVLLFPVVETPLKYLGIPMLWGGRESPVTLVTLSDYLLTTLAVCVAAPILEETLFRGYVITALRGPLGTLPAVLVSSAIFTSVHYVFGPGMLVYIFVFSLIPAYLYLRFGSLYPAVIMHATNNVIAYLLMPALSALS